MTRAARAALVVVLAVACVGSAPALAAPQLPVTGLSGLLAVSLVPATASLSTSGTTVSGTLGTSTIVDGRLGATGFDVSVTSTGFTLVGALAQTSASFIPGTAASVAASAPVGGTLSTTAAHALPASPLFHLSYTGAISLVNLTSSYTLSMSLTVPAPAAPGLYTGTVTQTVA